MLATGCGLTAVAALTAVLAAPPATADATGPTGSAYALSVATTLLDKPLATIDPRPTAAYPRGGSDSLAKVGPNLLGLVTADALTASAGLKGRTLTSAAGIADVVVRDILAAKVVSAECSANGATVTGRSSVADLVVLGQPIDVSVTRDIDVLGVATVRLNEQIRTGDSLTVNAVHVIVGAPVRGITSADIVLSQAKCTGMGAVPSTPPSTSSTTATTTRPSVTARTRPHATWSTTKPHPTTTTSAGKHGVRKTANGDDLAETGAAGILPISLIGLVLLAGGGTAMVVARRRRSAKD
jgi:LPXTG-motif cell wall-anchored protein